MDPVKLQKIHAMNMCYYSKKHKLVHGFLFYPPVTVLACSVLCSVAFWFPCLFSSMKLLLHNCLAVLLSSKFLFLLGNLIIILLIRESKLFASSSPPLVYYDEYINRRRASSATSLEEKKEGRVMGQDKYLYENESKIPEDAKLEVEKELEGLISNEELRKRADEFIARVNRQRRLEAKLQ